MDHAWMMIVLARHPSRPYPRRPPRFCSARKHWLARSLVRSCGTVTGVVLGLTRSRYWVALSPAQTSWSRCSTPGRPPSSPGMSAGSAFCLTSTRPGTGWGGTAPPQPGSRKTARSGSESTSAMRWYTPWGAQCADFNRHLTIYDKTAQRRWACMRWLVLLIWVMHG